MKLKGILFFTICFVIFPHCRKQTVLLKQTGMVFYPSTNSCFTNFTVEGNFIGAGLDNGVIRFPYTNPDSSWVKGMLEYAISSKSVYDEHHIAWNDTNTISMMLAINQDKYLGICYDKTMSTGNWNRDKLVWMNKYLEPVKQKYFTDSSQKIFFIKPLGNGDFIAGFLSADLAPFAYFYLLCFDENLNVKWKTKSTWYYGEWYNKDICIANHAIYLLSVSNTFEGNYKVEKYDFYGTKQDSTYSSPYGYKADRMLNDAGGFTVFSRYTSPVNPSAMVVSKFDFNSHLVEEKRIGTSLFSNNPNYTFEFNSKIIEHNGSYYFIVNVNDQTTATQMQHEAKLVKLDKSLEIVWVKTIDEARLSGNDSYLELYDDKFITIGKSIWKGLEGFSFIQTDMVGNIVK